MKKFWIFLLGIIVAVIGFHFFANKSEPTPDNPPINNEQPGDNNQTPNPSDPDDVMGVPQYTTNTFSIDNIASFQLFKLAEDNVTLNSVDTTNGLDQTQLEVGAIYNLHLDVAYGYEIVEVVYNSNCLLSAPIELSVQVTFTAVENGVFSVTTQIIEPELPDNYGEPISGRFMVHQSELFSSIKLYNNALEPIVVSGDMMDYSAELLIGHSYSVELEAVDGYVISQVDYYGETGVETIYTGKTQVASITFTATERNRFEISIMPLGYGTPTFNTFSLDNIESVKLYHREYEPYRYINEVLDTSNGLNNVEFIIGDFYRLELVPVLGYSITSALYNEQSMSLKHGLYNGSECGVFAVNFTAVEDGHLEFVTETSSTPIGQPTTNTFYLNNSTLVNLFKVEADGSLTLVDTSSGLNNTELTVGKEYCLELIPNDGYEITSFTYSDVTYYPTMSDSNTYYCNFFAVKKGYGAMLNVSCSSVE